MGAQRDIKRLVWEFLEKAFVRQIDPMSRWIWKYFNTAREVFTPSVLQKRERETKQKERVYTYSEVKSIVEHPYKGDGPIFPLIWK